MKTPIKIAALVALSLTASQALAFETEVERVGMLYINIPLSNRSSAPKIDQSVMGFRFGQTRISTDRAGSLFTYFKSRPALFDVQFGMVRSKYSPDNLRFGLMDLKLTGISSIEKTYINGQAVVGGVLLSQLAVGAAAVGGIAVVASASGSGSSSNDKPDTTSPSTSSTSSTSSDSSHDNDPNHDLAENEDDLDHDNEIDDNEADHANEKEDDSDKAEIDDDLPGHDSNDDDFASITPVATP